MLIIHQIRGLNTGTFLAAASGQVFSQGVARVSSGVRDTDLTVNNDATAYLGKKASTWTGDIVPMTDLRTRRTSRWPFASYLDRFATWHNHYLCRPTIWLHAVRSRCWTSTFSQTACGLCHPCLWIGADSMSYTWPRHTVCRHGYRPFQ